MPSTLANYPIWLQGGSYSARLDRQVVDITWTEGVVSPSTNALKVSQRAAGANLSVDIAVGRAIIQGDDISYQGKYLVANEVVVNLVVSAAPGTGTRIDYVYLQVNDPTSGGAAGNNAIVDLYTSPATLPNTAILLASILRTAGDVSVTNAMITDLRGTATSGLAANDPNNILANQVFS